LVGASFFADLLDNCDQYRIGSPSERCRRRIETHRRAVDLIDGLPT
jgi:hypothetical protein